MIAVAAAMYALAYPYLSGDIKAQKRAAALVSHSERAASSRNADPAKRRKLIAESLKDVEQKSKRKASLEQRIAQAGLSLSKVFSPEV